MWAEDNMDGSSKIDLRCAIYMRIWSETDRNEETEFMFLTPMQLGQGFDDDDGESIFSHCKSLMQGLSNPNVIA